MDSGPTAGTKRGPWLAKPLGPGLGLEEPWLVDAAVLDRHNPRQKTVVPKPTTFARFFNDFIHAEKLYAPQQGCGRCGSAVLPASVIVVFMRSLETGRWQIFKLNVKSSSYTIHHATYIKDSRSFRRPSG